MQLSYWERDTFVKKIDALIIGSGLVGLTAAIHLKEKRPDWHVVVVERGTFPSGASTKNAGFTCFGSVTEILDDLSNQSVDFVMETIKMRWDGLQKLQQRVGKSTMNYRNWGSYELFSNEDEQILTMSLAEMDRLNQLIKPITGIPTVFTERKDQINPFGFKGIKSLIYNAGEGQIHTGLMMQALIQLAQRLQILILNGVEIESFTELNNKVSVQSSTGWTLDAERVLIATNGFAHRLLETMDVRPARNQVMITEPIPDLKLKGCFHYDRGYIYFRNVENRVLIGGARNLDPVGETTDELKLNDQILNSLRNFLHEKILPENKISISQSWSGILGVGQTKRPIIQQIGSRISCAVRMGGMGVAIGSLVGEQGADLLLKS